MRYSNVFLMMVMIVTIACPALSQQRYLVTPTNEAIPLQKHESARHVMESLISAAGYKSVKWDASNAASGMCVLRLQADNFSETKKIVLMK